MRILLDSDILVRAAWNADGLASRLLRAILLGPHRLIVSPFVLGEVARVLAYPRLQARWRPSEERIQRYINLLATAADIVEITHVDRIITADPDDDFVLQTAIAGQADVLCTRDAHLLDPAVVDSCAARRIRVVNDIQLHRILTSPPPG